MLRSKLGAELRRWQRRFWQTSEDHGFHEPPHDNLYEKAALIHSEVSEFVEELRKGYTNEVYYRDDGKPEGPGMELADAAIRIMDAAEMLDIDLARCIEIKHLFNVTRPFMHGKQA